MRIIELTEVDALYSRFQGQASPQDCYLELDPEAETLRCDYNGEIGNAVPLSVWHNRCYRISIPCLTADAANDLMRRVSTAAQHVVDGYSADWDGNNTVGRLTDDAQEALHEIEHDCESLDADEHNTVQVYDASDWFESATADSLGITAETTDEQITAIAKDREANAECHVIEGCEEYLADLRDELAAIEDDAEADED